MAPHLFPSLCLEVLVSDCEEVEYRFSYRKIAQKGSTKFRRSQTRVGCHLSAGMPQLKLPGLLVLPYRHPASTARGFGAGASRGDALRGFKAASWPASRRGIPWSTRQRPSMSVQAQFATVVALARSPTL